MENHFKKKKAIGAPGSNMEDLGIQSWCQGGSKATPNVIF
jgi:hypothetical protein